MEKTNLGVRPVAPVGGKTSMGESEVVAFENKSLKEYIKDLDLAGPSNNIVSAKKHRTAMVVYYEKVDKVAAKRVKNLFKFLNLDY